MFVFSAIYKALSAIFQAIYELNVFFSRRSVRASNEYRTLRTRLDSVHVFDGPMLRVFV